MANEQPERGTDPKRAVGRRHPEDVKLAIGKLLAQGTPEGTQEALALSLGVTPRTLRSWKKRAEMAPAERRRPGRPRRPPAERASLMTRVYAIQDAHSWQLSGRGVHRLLEKRVPLQRVQDVMRVLRTARARWLRALREENRLHVRVLARDTIWALDATHLGRDLHEQAVWAELVRDVASTKTLGASIGPAPSSQDVVELLERIVLVTGVKPLVIISDNGSENRGALDTWCTQYDIVHLYNLPRTPQHNACAEHGNGELKAVSGLGKGHRIRSVSQSAIAVLVALDHIDGQKRRPTRDDRTARQAYLALPAANALVDRTAFHRETHCAIDAAVQGLEHKREQRMATREAILRTLEGNGLVTRTRGRRPLQLAKEEGVS